MKAYFLTLLATALIVTVVGILSPAGEKGGISKHVGLLSALCLICVLIAPLHGLSDSLGEFMAGDVDLPWDEPTTDGNGTNQTQELLDAVGSDYFTAMLAQKLESAFAITPGEVRCAAGWTTENGKATPKKVSVILSGRAIWKDTGAIEAYVTELLGCPCESVIE